MSDFFIMIRSNILLSETRLKYTSVRIALTVYETVDASAEPEIPSTGIKRKFKGTLTTSEVMEI